MRINEARRRNPAGATGGAGDDTSYVDEGGDGTADLQIRVNTVALNAGGFIL